MGRRGFPAAPSSVKLALGETRPSRVNFLEPSPQRHAPAMPRDMDDGAKAVWRRVLREMGHTEVIRAADADVLRCYCEAVSQYQVTMRMLATSSPLIRNRGELVKNPLHQIVRDNRDAVRLFARELGLSPSGRAGLNVEMTGAVGDIEDVIGPAPRRLYAVGGSDG